MRGGPCGAVVQMHVEALGDANVGMAHHLGENRNTKLWRSGEACCLAPSAGVVSRPGPRPGKEVIPNRTYPPRRSS
jgi:hypothetical protein